MFSYIGLWIAVIYPLFALIMSGIYYFKFPQYHNTRILLALVAFILLTLTGLLLIFVQPYWPLAIRADSRLSFLIAIFTLTMFIYQALILYSQSKGQQGRNVLLVSVAILAITSISYAIYAIHTIVTSIAH